MSNKFKNSNINIANKSFNNTYFFHYSAILVIYMYRIYNGSLLYCNTDSNISHKIWFLILCWNDYHKDAELQLQNQTLAGHWKSLYFHFLHVNESNILWLTTIINMINNNNNNNNNI